MPISVGDLVMIVRGHSCVVSVAGGIPFIVTGFANPICGGWHCRFCNKDNAWGPEIAATGYKKANIPLSWLLRIDPSALKDNVPRDERIAA